MANDRTPNGARINKPANTPPVPHRHNFADIVGFDTGSDGDVPVRDGDEWVPSPGTPIGKVTPNSPSFTWHSSTYFSDANASFTSVTVKLTPPTYNTNGTTFFGASSYTMQWRYTDPYTNAGTGKRSDWVSAKAMADQEDIVGIALTSTIGVSISSIAFASGTATVTTSTPHGLMAGDYLEITGANAANNGTYKVALVPSTTTFTYSSSSGGNQGSGGTVTSQVATVTTAGDHGLLVGDRAVIEASSTTANNGRWTVRSVPDTNKFTFAGGASGGVNQAASGRVLTTSISTIGIKPGSVISVRASVTDVYNNTSPWSDITSINVDKTANGPVKPSTPIVEAKLGGIQVTWDGKDSLGAAQADDYAYTEVYLSPSSSFTSQLPSDAYKVGRLTGAGSLLLLKDADGVPLTTNTTYYVALVSYNAVGNASAPSTPASARTDILLKTDIGEGQIGKDFVSFDARAIGGIATTVGTAAPQNPKDGDIWLDTTIVAGQTGAAQKRWRVTNPATGAGVWDPIELNALSLAANCITATQMAAGAITAGSAVIGDAAIRSAQIGSVSADTITSGTLRAGQVTVSTVDKTVVDPTSVNRVVFNSQGIFAYPAGSTNPSVSIPVTGTATFSGTLAAGTSLISPVIKTSASAGPSGSTTGVGVVFDTTGIKAYGPLEGGVNGETFSVSATNGKVMITGPTITGGSLSVGKNLADNYWTKIADNGQMTMNSPTGLAAIQINNNGNSDNRLEISALGLAFNQQNNSPRGILHRPYSYTDKFYIASGASAGIDFQVPAGTSKLSVTTSGVTVPVITGTTTFEGKVTASNGVEISNGLTVSGLSKFNSKVEVNATNGLEVVLGGLTVTAGGASVSGGISVSGLTEAKNNLSVAGNASVTGTMTVTNTSTLNGTTNLNGNVNFKSGTTIDFNSATVTGLNVTATVPKTFTANNITSESGSNLILATSSAADNVVLRTGGTNRFFANGGNGLITLNGNILTTGSISTNDGSALVLSRGNTSGALSGSAITIGTDTTTCGNNFVPTSTNTKLLGASNLVWKEAYVSGAKWTGSDASIKTNISPIVASGFQITAQGVPRGSTNSAYGLTLVRALTPVTYNRILPVYTTDADGNETQTGTTLSAVESGFVADDVVAAITAKGLAWGGYQYANGMYFLNYEALIAPVVAAVQQLDAECMRTGSAISGSNITGTISGVVYQTTLNGSGRISLGETMAPDRIRFYSSGSVAGDLGPAANGISVYGGLTVSSGLSVSLGATVASGNLEVTSGSLITSSTTWLGKSGTDVAFRVDSNGNVYSLGITKTYSNDSNYNMRIAGTGGQGQIFRNNSSIRMKDAVVSLGASLSGVPMAKQGSDAFVNPYDALNVSPSQFRSALETDEYATFFGFIAEDVAEKFPFAAVWDENGIPEGVKDRPILAALLAVVADQQQRLDDLTAQVAALT